MWLATVAEACRRTGWRVHAWVLMGNHQHLLLETTEANLVNGMKWLQGAYAQRYNSRHRERGHLFLGVTGRCRWRWMRRAIFKS
jgi:REP element-mobilizing transposase RayT